MSGEFERALERETAKLYEHMQRVCSHAVGVATDTCIYCGTTKAEIEGAALGEVPWCHEAYARKRAERPLTGLATIINNSGTIRMATPEEGRA